MKTQIDLSGKITVAQWRVLKKYLAGRYSPFSASAEDMRLLDEVTQAAEKACEEKNAYDEIDGDLLKWYAEKILFPKNEGAKQ